MQIVVVGAGVVGLAAAWALVQAGHSVTVVDRASGPAQGASGQNGAQLSYSYVAPLASPQTLRALPSLLLKGSSPLRIDWRQGPTLWAWLARFAWACNARKAHATTQSLLALALESRDSLHHYVQTLTPNERAQTAHAMPGKLVLLHSQAKVDAALRDADLLVQHGVVQQVLDHAQCLQREPALQSCDTGFMAGVFTASDEVVDAQALCLALVTTLRRSGRCQFWWNAAVQGPADGPPGGAKLSRLDVVVDGHRQTVSGDAFVLANGVAVAALAPAFGERVWVQGMRGFSLHVPSTWLERMPKVSVTDTSLHTVFAPLQTAASAAQPAQWHLRVAGMAELMGPHAVIDPSRVQALRASVGRVFGWSAQANTQADHLMQPWAGVRPVTPDGLPVIKKLRAWPNVYLNAGQGALGLTLAFGSAQRLLVLIDQPTQTVSATATKSVNVTRASANTAPGSSRFGKHR
jgi:D-amino-acid dehydrogenase